MAGYAEPCSLCGNNKRRRFAFTSRSDDGTLRFPLHSPPPTPRPRSKSDLTPLPTPPAVVPRADAQKTSSPPTAADHGCPDGAAAPAVRSLSPPKTPLSGRRGGVASVPLPESSGDSNPVTAAVPEARPVIAVTAAVTARTSSTSHACGSGRRPTRADAHGSGEKKGVNTKKEGEREAAAAAAAAAAASGEEDVEVAAMRIRCTCGRVQEFLYRQQRTTTP